VALAIQRTTQSELTEIAHFSAAAFARTFGYLYAPEALSAHLDRSFSAAYYARHYDQQTIWHVRDTRGAIVACASCLHQVGLPVGDAPNGSIEIERFYLHPDHHGTGLAHRLMQHVLAQTAHAPHLYLGVWSENIRAQRFYAHYGFTHVGCYYYYVGPHADKEWMMRRDQPQHR
jgi:ribosomal protein S18 acetylase RimI-like enzyme